MTDDEAYVRELLAILTNPHPTGISPDDPYGQADDRIDRYDGFGRDYWVESLRSVYEGPWAELEVTFGLDITAASDDPRFRNLPAEGTFRVTFDREWRELSRYTEPAAYAPRIAARVGPEAGRLISRRRLRGPEPIDLDAVRATLPSRDKLWGQLLTFLGWNGSARQVAPGRIEMTIDVEDSQPTGRLTVLVTPEQWIDFVVRNNGWQLALDEVIGPRQDDELFVVFTEGDFARSIRERLPPVHGGIEMERRIAELRASGAEGGWFAHRPDGQVDREPS